MILVVARGTDRAPPNRMRRTILLFAVTIFPAALVELPAYAEEPAAERLHMRPKKRLSAAQKRARAATHEAPPEGPPEGPHRTPRTAGAPAVASTGADLRPGRVIDAPQAPGPDSSTPREVAPAASVETKRDRKRDRDTVQPPYPTGYDPGRNLQGTQGFAPTNTSVVP